MTIDERMTIDQRIRATLGSAQAWLHKYDMACKGKWGRVFIGPTSCPLCALYWDDDCKSCPIALYTGQKRCRGTPYKLAEEAIANAVYDYQTSTDDCTTKTKSELEEEKRSIDSIAAEYTFLVDLAFDLWEWDQRERGEWEDQCQHSKT